MMKKLHLFAIVTALVIVAAQCYLEELPLMAREPERVFDLERDTAFGEGPYPDSRVYYRNPRYKRSVNETTLPVFGNINVLGTYFTIITVANSTMRVVVDTGSSVLYVPSTQCTISSGPNAGLPCFSPDPKLDLSTADVSSIACGSTGCTGCSNSVCTVSTTFGDGSSVSALGQTATIGIGNLVATDASFGAAVNVSEGFVNDPGSEIDGLWGMAFQVFPDNSLIVLPTVLDTLFDQNPQVDRAFSLRLDLDGGSLLIGGVNDSDIVGPLEFTPLIEGGWYVVNNPRLYTGSSSSNLTQVSFDPGELIAIVDSGATLINLPDTYWNALQTGMKNAAGCPPHMCDQPTIFNDTRFCFTDFPFDEYPTIAFLLPRVHNPTFSEGNENFTETANLTRLILNPRQYMIATTDSRNETCVSFGLTHGGNFLIFGDTMLTQYYTVFDRANLQVGFSSRIAQAIEPAAPFVPFGSVSAAPGSSSMWSALAAIAVACAVWILS